MGNIFKKGNTKVKRRLVLESVSADRTALLPAYCQVKQIYLRRTSTNDTTGGIRIGNAAAGAQLLAAVALGTQNLPAVGTVVAPLISASDQTLYISTASAWNSAVIDVVIEYDELIKSADLSDLTTGSYAGKQQADSAY